MNIESTPPQKAPTIPLSLYIHFPWCLSKCPYCDFNSYAIADKSSITTYVNKLLIDLEHTIPDYKNKELVSIYFGGGTPSLLPPNSVVTIVPFSFRSSINPRFSADCNCFLMVSIVNPVRLWSKS